MTQNAPSPKQTQTELFMIYILLLLGLAAGVVLFASVIFPHGVHVVGASKWSDFNDGETDAGIHGNFIFGKDAKANMPFLHSLLSGNAAGWISKAEAPTVTLPRLKAILAGIVPGYLDVVRNFDSPALESDSLINQMLLNDRKMVFYGDKTWTDLFPNHFERSDATTSFFVSDYTEVDFNVSRHIHTEFQNDDWSAMFLHFLGVDHIGHVYGAFNDIMRAKLKEMDGVLSDIYSSMGEDTLLAVLSDHGMTIDGNHGGSSEGEAESVFIVADKLKHRHTESREAVKGRSGTGKDTIRQVDICPTLSLLLGLPIPRGNTGRAVTNALAMAMVGDGDDHDVIARGLYANAQQLANLLKAMSSPIAQEKLASFTSTLTEMELEAWLTSTSEWLQTQAMSHEDAKLMVGLMVSGCSAISIALLALFSVSAGFNSRMRLGMKLRWVWVWAGVLILMTIAGAGVFMLDFDFNFDGDVIIYVLSGSYMVWTVFLWTCLLTEYRVLFATLATIYRQVKGFQLWIMFLLCIHFALLFGSSYIEEDHLCWYFILSTCQVADLFFELKHSLTSSDSKPRLKKILTLIGLTYVSRSWNSSGDKWLSLPDIGKTLESKDHAMYLDALSVITVVIAGVVIGMFLYRHHHHQKAVTYIAAIMYILSLTMATRVVDGLMDTSEEARMWNARIVFVMLFVCVLMVSVSDIGIGIDKGHVALAVLFALSVLLHRRRDSFLLLLMTSQIFILIDLYATANDSDSDKMNRRLLYLMMFFSSGTAFFSMLGHNVSLSSIYIAGAFSGLSTYNMYIVGFFTFIITYSGQLLSLCGVCSAIVKADNYSNSSTHTRTYMCIAYVLVLMANRSIELVLYSIGFLFFRSHVFVWSVFSPKYLQLVMEVVVLYGCGGMVVAGVELLISSDVSRKRTRSLKQE